MSLASGRVSSEVARNDIVGEMQTVVVRHEDTLINVARQSKLGSVEIVAANPGVDPWIPGEDRRITLPTAHLLPDAPRRGLVVNLGKMRIYRFSEDGRVLDTWPIGVGRRGFTTPLGQTKIIRKRANPSWTPTAAARSEDPDLPAVVPPGPHNPLGRFALDLSWPAYLIHGTNKPEGVGRPVSRGCIRMYPEDIATLFDLAAVGTPVTVVDQVAKFGSSNGSFFIEVHPSRRQADQLERKGLFYPKRVATM